MSLGIVAHAFNLSTQEAIWELLSLRPAWSTEWVPQQPELHRETLSWKSKNRGWGFSSAVERLPSERKALGSVPSSEKKKKKRKKKKEIPQTKPNQTRQFLLTAEGHNLPILYCSCSLSAPSAALSSLESRPFRLLEKNNKQIHQCPFGKLMVLKSKWLEELFFVCFLFSLIHINTVYRLRFCFFKVFAHFHLCIKAFIFYYILFIWGGCILFTMCGSQRTTCKSWFLHSTVWIGAVETDPRLGSRNLLSLAL